MMCWFQFKRIRTKLIFWFLVLGLVPLSLGIIINYLQRLNSIREAGYEKLMAVRDNKAEQIEYWLANRSLEARTIASNTDFIDAVVAMQNTSGRSRQKIIRKTIHDLFDEFQMAHPEIKQMQLFQMVGDSILSVIDNSIAPINQERKDAIDEVTRTGVMNFSKLFNLPEYTAMAITTPVFAGHDHEATELVAVFQVIIDVKSAFKSKLTNVPELGETGEILLVNQDGLALTDLQKIPNAPLRYRIVAKPATFARMGEEGVINDKDYSGTPVLAAYTFIRLTHWGLIVKQDSREISKPVRVLLFDFAGLLIFSVILLVAMAAVVAESISRPIIGLTEHAKRIQSSEYEPVVLHSKDELGILAASFNDMAANIRNQLGMQQGMSQISGSLVGSVSTNQFYGNLIKSLAKVSDASHICIMAKPLEPGSTNFSIARQWYKVGMANFSNRKWTKEELEWLVDMKVKSMEVSAFRLNETLSSEVCQTEQTEVITIPIWIEKELLALVLLVADGTFPDGVSEIMEKTRATISIGFSNALATDRLSLMANNLFDINQQLEKQKDELVKKSQQLKKSADELHERNVELEIQRKEVESINRLKSEFLSNMSHELRTPLHVILTLSGVIKDQLLDRFQNEEEREYLEVIDRNGQILLKLISDILDLSRIEAGKEVLEIRPIPIVSLIENIIYNIQALATEKGLCLTIDREGEIPILYSDEEKLFQVFQNIIGNAIKFTKEGGVTIKVYEDNGEVVVDVVDTGIGIPEDQLKKIFNEFVQVDGSTTRNYMGTGLGLAIARKTIELLHGKIFVVSSLGFGSTFSVRIPVNFEDEKISEAHEHIAL